ncbi:radical SAM protein [Breoghania sp. L-A4]|uniref:B12-binding domain-containing radical SAM protein n=1 Tax=Breoghania sp. L-A4 TaxID=2304600 RepID=UPI000E35C2AA|nr:radical SAM protein [Breoghania sp. L-A4]AXS42684.1 radical SAM protein [Breoghania sp. L-A4]
MIKPTHYDDDGYPIQWLRSAIPSNTLACLNGLAEDARSRDILGPGVDIRLHTFDETNRRVRPEKIARQLRRDGGRVLIGLVGVQSNQFPRAVDLARRFRAQGLTVMIGGFHVSGCISMLPEMPPEMVAAQAEGISFFAGEAEEGRLDEVFRDAYKGELKPLYNYMKDLPGLVGEPTPILPNQHVGRTAGSHSSFDLGRGCPYQCSFCTIINVQGRKSRFRSPDDLEGIIRDNLAQGINRFFITDDNFARNREWEAFFDRLITMREVEKLDIKFIIQVDTLCHQIKGFVDKAARAGVNRVFIGLENINPDNLIAAKKRQNKITEYRDMLQAWRDHGCTTYAGYILGFPGDTRESILRDIAIIQKELPLDLLEFFFLTPLPGSEDHLTLYKKGEWMDPDLNKYDLNHRVSHHGKMSDAEWEQVYREAWDAYYSPEHVETILKRAAAHPKGRPGNKLFLMMWFYLMVKYEGVHPLEGGYMRLKHRRDRRSGMPIESPLVFYPKFFVESLAKQLAYGMEFLKVYFRYRRVKRAPDRRSYTDKALSTAVMDDLDAMEMFTQTDGGKAAVAKSRRDKELRAAARTAAE